MLASTAGEFNKKLVGSLKKIWDRDKGKRKGEFVNLADTKNNTEIQNDAWNMIPKDTKDMIEDQFGEDGFMVRKDMIDNAVGYRGLSLGEAWAGPSNMSHDTKKAIRDFATAVRGKNAYRDLTIATKAIQAGVSVAKNMIVVTSIVIPIANAASNVQQIMIHGVSPRDIWNGLKTKLVEVERLQKLEKRIAEIQALKAVNRNKDVELRKLLAEEKSIDDSISRMSIGAMVKAGEFTTIAEGELSLDAALTQGSWSDQLTKAVDRIPAKLGVVGRYAAISRDTAVFKGLSRSVQYGDFLAKSILYDHLTKKKNQTHEQAMKVVIDEFVAYNILPSRERQAAEQIGAMWFWAYKLRSIKVAQRMIRNNPLRVMMAGFGGPLIPDVPGVNVGSPITDNAISAIADGRAGYSIGWGMLFRAPSLHPILGWMY